jgi:RNA polymerase sigma factor (sigma-70 family)
MEVSALRYSGGIGLHARSPLLRLQSDERLITLIRRGSTAAFEVLVARYHARLLSFCRHLLGSREDAEDVLQEVFSAAFNAILDDDRPINVRPWLYRIARNRSLNHLRRIQAVGVDSMDIHLSEHGTTTADKVHEREEFRMLVGDIQGLPETQRTALVLREMDALSYEQIAEAMETTVPSVKSLLVRARVSLAEAAQARVLTCAQVRVELGECAEGLRRRPGALVRRHLRTCERCAMFKGQLNETSKALTAVLPIGGFFLLRKLAILHIGHSAGAGAGAGSGASGASAAGQAAAVGSTAAAGTAAVMGSTTTGFLSASVGAIATKAVAGLAAAALVTAGAVEVEQPRSTQVRHHAGTSTQVASVPSRTAPPATVTQAPLVHTTIERHVAPAHPHKPAAPKARAQKKTPPKATDTHTAAVTTKPAAKTKTPPPPPPGRTQTQTDATVLAGSAPASTPTTATTGCPATSTTTTTTTSSTPAVSSTPSPSTTTTQSTPSTQSSDPSSTTTTTGTTPDSTGTATSPTTTTTTTSTTPTAASADAAAPDPSPGSCSSGSSGSAAAGSALASPSGGVSP